jgi:hypothetical protein
MWSGLRFMRRVGFGITRFRVLRGGPNAFTLRFGRSEELMVIPCGCAAMSCELQNAKIRTDNGEKTA